MASPFSKAGSPFADGCGGTSNGFKRFEDEMKNPFQQQAATHRNFDFGSTAPFHASSNIHEPKNPFQQSTYGGGSSCEAPSTTGSSILGHASISSFSFGKGSPFLVASTKPKPKNPFQQSTLLGGECVASAGSGQTKAGRSVFGHDAPSVPFSFSNGKASPLTFTNENHVPSNPWPQSKVSSPFSFGKAPLLGEGIHQHEPEKGHPWTSSFSFGEASPFAHKPEVKNPFQKSILPGGGSSLSSLSHMEAGRPIFGRASTSFGAPFGQPACSTLDQNPLSPFGPASLKVSPQAFWRSPNSNDNSGTGTKLGGFVRTPTSQGISVYDNRGPSPCRQNPSSTPPFSVFGSAATVIRFHSLPLTLASGFPSAGPFQSLRPFGGSRPGCGDLPAMDSMEEDKLLSLSATPPYENTSPEELRWEEYQAKKIDASQMTSNVATCSFSMPNIVKNGGAALNSDVSTPNAVDNSAPAWKFSNNGGSVASSSAISSSWSSGLINSIHSPSCPILGLPSTSASVLGLPSTSAPMLGSPSISSSCSLQSNNCLEWPQQSLQIPTFSLPSPKTTVTSSSSGTGVDQNISAQRPLASETPASTFAAPSRSSFTLSTVEGGLSVMRGISSLPESGKCCQAKTISLLTSKQVFQKTVIRMQTRRHGSLKKDGPRVSFLDDYSDPDDSRNMDASFVACENPKTLLLHTPWLENGGTRNGTQKDNLIQAMLHGKHPQ